MDAYYTNLEFKRIRHLLYVDEREDEFLADIFDDISNGRVVPTVQQEERLYSQYWGQLMGVAKRYMSDRETAREIVNDSFVKAFRGLSSFKGDGLDKVAVFRAWLLRITVNTAIDRLRAERIMPETLSLDELDGLTMVEIFDTLQVDDILMLLKRLPDIHRAIFNLYELEGYSHDEIGEMMGIPTSSSRVYLAKAKQRLRELYIKYFGGRHDG